jgi:hypothetical protein
VPSREALTKYDASFFYDNGTGTSGTRMVQTTSRRPQTAGTPQSLSTERSSSALSTTFISRSSRPRRSQPPVARRVTVHRDIEVEKLV